jgi:hypothetical protein
MFEVIYFCQNMIRKKKQKGGFIMKKSLLSVTGCALALGLVAAPAASASTVKHAKEKVSVEHNEYSNHLTNVVFDKDLAKLAFNKHGIKIPAHKLREYKFFRTPLNINQLDTNIQSLVQKVDGFYSTPTTAEKELDFYKNTLSKLNAKSMQLAYFQKQLDYISNIYGITQYLTPLNDKLSNLQLSIANEITKLNQLHSNFVPITSLDSNNQNQDS